MKTFYTDGACSGNPGPGGWAVILLENDTVTRKWGGFQNNTTNNRMEL
ncbi:ribonuclease HI, partial [bacterium]|nr:ribonuclease HI [bacterium]